MATKEAKDIQIYTGSQWKSLKDQKMYDGSSWRAFGVGSGVSNGTDWYVLNASSSGTTLESNQINLQIDFFWHEGLNTFTKKLVVWAVKAVESNVSIEYKVKYNPDGNLNSSSSTTVTFTVQITKGNSSSFVNTSIPASNITAKLVSATIKAPAEGKDSKYQYLVSSSSGQSI